MMYELPEMRSITYRQCTDTEIRTLVLPSVVLLYVEEGSKYVSSRSNTVQCAASGEFAFLQPGKELTIRNCPGSTGGYHAKGLVFESDALPEHPYCYSDSSKEFRCFCGDTEIVDAFIRLRMALESSDLPPQVVHARFYELKAWLTRLGIQLSPARTRTLTEKLRTLLASDLSHPWRGTEVAARMGMSEATLRRSLVREDTCFTAIMRETRLQSALERLQTTNETLSEILFALGSRRIRTLRTFLRSVSNSRLAIFGHEVKSE